MRHAIVDGSGRVTNIVMWDRAGAWRPEGGVAIPCGPDVHIGASWDGHMFRDERRPAKRRSSLPEIVYRRYRRIERVYAEEAGRLHVSAAGRETMRLGALSFVGRLQQADSAAAADAIAAEAEHWLRSFVEPEAAGPVVESPAPAPPAPAGEPAAAGESAEALPRFLGETAPSTPDDKPGWNEILAAASAGERAGEAPGMEPPPAPPEPADPRSDEQVRADARHILERAVMDRETTLIGGEMAQIRYETAVRARNGSGDAQALLVEEARQREVSVQALAEQIIAERKAREAAVMAIYATLARMEALLEVAHRDQIATLVMEGLAEIEGGGRGDGQLHQA